MRTFSAEVHQVERLTVRYSLATMALDEPFAAECGTGVSLSSPDHSDLLPVAWTPLGLDGESRSLTILCDDRDHRQERLTKVPLGGRYTLRGPWGRALRLDPRSRHVLLLGWEEHLAHLIPLCRRLLQEGVAVVVVSAAREEEDALPARLFPPDVEIRSLVGRDSRSLALIEAAAPLMAWADALYAALPDHMYGPLLATVRRERLAVRRGLVNVHVTTGLACLVGACALCPIPLARGGYRLACKEGPFIDLLELQTGE